MMDAARRGGALVAFLVLSSACGANPGLPAAPTSTPGPPTTSPPDALDAPGFPAVSRPARVYVAVNSPASAYHGSRLASRYVLYDDGTFALQYSSANYPFFEYRGIYHEADGAMTFDWEGWSVAGPWGATGWLSDDVLTVRYNLIMQMTDFEDGAFIRAK